MEENKEIKQENNQDLIEEVKEKVGEDVQVQTSIPEPTLSKHISYTLPKFHRRVLANLIDFLLFLVAFVTIFISSRAIAGTTPYYGTAVREIERIKIQSSLYVDFETAGRVVDIVEFYNLDTKLTSKGKLWSLMTRVDDYIIFLGKECGEEVGDEFQKIYDDYRLNDNMKYEGIPYFVRNNEGRIILNNECNASFQNYYDEVYTPFIKMDCLSFMMVRVPHYHEYTTYLSNMLMFVEIPVSFVLGAILVYMVPPLCFRRGRKTIGKWAYKIGLVDSNLTNVKIGRIIARQSIVIFAELCLSIVTLCAPIIISFSMMAFSKKKQGFPDYMLGCREIDTTVDKIYYSKEEIVYELARQQGGAPDFKLPNRNY